ncbi:hypothetical protein YC2023_081706 [Brassica napus]
MVLTSWGLTVGVKIGHDGINMLEGKKNTNAIPVSEYEKLIVASDEPGDGLLASPSISSSVASSSSSSGMALQMTYEEKLEIPIVVALREYKKP